MTEILFNGELILSKEKIKELLKEKKIIPVIKKIQDPNCGIILKN